MYTVNIKHYAAAVESSPVAMPICPVFVPAGSYVDSAAYEGTRYDSNVEGWGKLGFNVDPEVGVPFPSGIHNINMSKVGTVGTDDKGEYTEVEFEVESYKDMIFYKTLAKDLADQGFVITVTEGEASVDTETGTEGEGEVTE